MVRKVNFLLTLLFLPLLGTAQSGKVIIQIEGISLEKGGEISVGIFTKENFPKPGRQFLGQEIPIQASSMEVVFEEVPVGSYAFVAFQDSDANKKLKSNIVGYPLEPIGFSRDAKMRLGPPSFSDAKIEVLADEPLVVIIKLK